MPENNFIFYDEKEGIKKPRKVRKPVVKPIIEKTADKVEEKSVASIFEKPKAAPVETRKSEKNDSPLFGLAVVTIIILGIIGLVFGYTKDKITALQNGGQEINNNLSQQVTDLKAQLDTLKQQASSLQQADSADKAVVMDLFDKNRSLPTRVDATGWSVLNDASLSFSVSYPKTWEVVGVSSTDNNATKMKQELVSLQPIGQANFVGAMSVQSAYPQYAKQTLKDKLNTFKSLNLIDEKEFSGGIALYYISVNASKQEVPTILFLTETNIYGATFNISNKTVAGYLGFRKDFEQIAATFTLVKKK